MIIFKYNVYNCRVSKFSQILKDPRFISDLPIWRKWGLKMRTKLVSEWNKTSLQEEEQKEINNDFYKLSLYIRILLFQTMYRSLSTQESDDMKELYFHYFKKEYDGKALEIIENKIKKLTQLFEAETPEAADEAEFNFDDYVRKIEEFQDKKDLSNIFLYQLPVYEHAAIVAIQKLNQKANQDA